jgi:hypothetical protein
MPPQLPLKPARIPNCSVDRPKLEFIRSIDRSQYSGADRYRAREVSACFSAADARFQPADGTANDIGHQALSATSPRASFPTSMPNYWFLDEHANVPGAAANQHYPGEGGRMRSRYGAIALSAAILAIAALDYTWLQGLGFPDGHLTELDRARIPLHRVFIGLSVLGGLCSLYLAIASAKQRQTGLLAVISFYLAVGFTIVLIDWYLSSHLNAGTGG